MPVKFSLASAHLLILCKNVFKNLIIAATIKNPPRASGHKTENEEHGEENESKFIKQNKGI